VDSHGSFPRNLIFDMRSFRAFFRDLLLVRLWRHLGVHRRRQFFLLLGLIFISASAEVVSLGAVLPFLGILTAPERVYAYPGVAAAVGSLGLTSADQLLLPITLAFSAMAVFTAVVRIVLLWFTNRLAFCSGADLSLDIYRRTLYQPYPVHVLRNSSEVISGINNKVATGVAVLQQALVLISSMVLIFAIAAALLVIDFVIAVTSCTVFGGAYALLSLFLKRKLKRNSQRIAVGQTQVVKALQEGLGGIRDVLLDGTQPVYCSVFNQASQQLRQAQGNNQFLAGSPRFAMESLGMVLIAALAYVLSLQSGGVATALPVLGALALGAQRLLPALQQAYNSWATIQSSHASLLATVELLDQQVPAELLLAPPAPLRFADAIQFQGVKFRYAPGGPWVINGIDLAIRKGEKVAFIGSTGSGKSTTLDLLMGLINPNEGRFLLDSRPLSQNQVRAWQRTVAHVPQSIFLADATIAQNIALCVPAAEIDMERVRRAAAQAQIAGFIESHARGYDAIVGERGVRLSGGQRQRIGIARALYKEADVLVFDEATSALDNTTEQAVMEAIQGLGQHLTIILIAHRLTTVRSCDKIFQLESGRVVAQGSYKELLATSETFRQMAASVAQ
jgi:ABC-type multidrug transport system fused ATPase/permease subunit